jgi:hypothetical protein
MMKLLERILQALVFRVWKVGYLTLLCPMENFTALRLGGQWDMLTVVTLETFTF